MRLIDADELIKYTNNQKNKSISANDIAKFPTVIDTSWHTSDKDNLPDKLQTECLCIYLTDDNSPTPIKLYLAENYDENKDETVLEWTDYDNKVYNKEEVLAWRYAECPKEFLDKIATEQFMIGDILRDILNTQKSSK